MTDTKTAQDQATASNSQAPPAAPDPEKATSGERALAAVAFAFGLFILAMAFDMFTNGGLSRLIPKAGSDDG